MEEVQWNSIDKKQNGLKYSKNDKSSTLPRVLFYKIWKKHNEIKFKKMNNWKTKKQPPHLYSNFIKD